MRTFDILPMHKTMFAVDRRAFDRWIRACVVIGSILAAGLVAIVLVGPNSMRPGHAVTQGSAAEKPAERSGVLLEYRIVF
jgi:hypothetical protein